MKFLKFVLIPAALTLSACSTLAPTAGKKFDVENKWQCAKLCAEADMTFEALVVVAGMSGCVCGVKAEQKSHNAGAVMGGAMAALLAEQEANNQQQAKK